MTVFGARVGGRVEALQHKNLQNMTELNYARLPLAGVRRIYRLPPLPPTSKTRVTEKYLMRDRCCSRWVPFGPDGDDPGLHFTGLGPTGVTSLKALVPFGLRWARQGAQMSYLALLRRRQPQLEGHGGGGQVRAGLCGTLSPVARI